MSSQAVKLSDNQLPAISRFITDNNGDGKAVFSNRIDEELQWQELPDGARFCLGFTTRKTPVDMSNGKDLSDYERDLENKPGIMIPGGTVLRLVDMQPGALSPMHRTVSLDYGVVLEGEVELVLDSGEVRLMRRGDVAIQRGTNHAWKNASETRWARMLYVLQESELVRIGSNTLNEDYGGISGVRPSKP
jgi:quercetin dioxygenase-like cupin family protein